MPHKISILVRADVSHSSVELLVTGCLTASTVPILTAQISRARELGPSGPILVDLTAAQHIDSEAFETLRNVARAASSDLEAPLRFALPTDEPTCPSPERSASTAR